MKLKERAMECHGGLFMEFPEESARRTTNKQTAVDPEKSGRTADKRANTAGEIGPAACRRAVPTPSKENLQARLVAATRPQGSSFRKGRSQKMAEKGNEDQHFTVSKKSLLNKIENSTNDKTTAPFVSMQRQTLAIPLLSE